MELGIHKQGQGHWTRLMTFMGGMTLFAWGAAWLSGQISKFDLPRDDQGNPIVEPQLIQGGAFVIVLIIGAAACYWFAYNRVSTSEFLIATEGEMKKVNWSSKRELMGSTWVVIGISLLFAVLLFVIDIGFSNLFRAIGVLESGG